MSICNQDLVYQENTNTKSVFGIYVPNFLVFSLYSIGILSTALLKFGLILVFFGRIKIGLVFGFCGCHFIGIGLISVCHFPESGISNTDLNTRRSGEVMPLHTHLNTRRGGVGAAPVWSGRWRRGRTGPGSPGRGRGVSPCGGEDGKRGEGGREGAWRVSPAATGGAGACPGARGSTTAGR